MTPPCEIRLPALDPGCWSRSRGSQPPPGWRSLAARLALAAQSSRLVLVGRLLLARGVRHAEACVLGSAVRHAEACVPGSAVRLVRCGPSGGIPFRRPGGLIRLPVGLQVTPGGAHPRERWGDLGGPRWRRAGLDAAGADVLGGIAEAGRDAEVGKLAVVQHGRLECQPEEAAQLADGRLRVGCQVLVADRVAGQPAAGLLDLAHVPERVGGYFLQAAGAGYLP